MIKILSNLLKKENDEVKRASFLKVITLLRVTLLSVNLDKTWIKWRVGDIRVMQDHIEQHSSKIIQQLITFWVGEGRGMNLDHTYEAGSLNLISWKVTSVITATLTSLFPLRFGYETSNLRALQRAIKAMMNGNDVDTLIYRTPKFSGQPRAGFSCEKNGSRIMEEWINLLTFFLIHNRKIVFPPKVIVFRFWIL